MFSRFYAGRNLFGSGAQNYDVQLESLEHFIMLVISMSFKRPQKVPN